MRTKTILLTAVLAVATAATSMADVFSVNVVGYVNTAVPNGYSIVANPLNATNNTLVNLIPAPPEGSAIYRMVGGNYTIFHFEQDDNGVLGWSGNPTLLPGEGFFFLNNGSPFTNTFVGEVVQGTTTNAVPGGFSLLSSIVPQAAALDSILLFPIAEHDTVYLFRGDYVINNYEQDDNGVLGWSLGSAPVPNVGEGFLFRTAVAKTPGWVRTFTVN